VRVAWVVAAKDLRQRLRDRTAILIAFVFPSVIAAIITGAFGSGFGPGTASFHVNVAVADLDHTPLSGAFFTQVLGSPQLRSQFTPRAVSSEAGARDLVDGHGAAVGFVIPRGFQASVEAGRRASITLIRRTADPIVGDIGQAIATGFTDQINASRIAVFTALRSGAPIRDVGHLAREAASARMSVRLVDAGVATRRVSGANYFGPGMAMFFLFFIVGTGARSLFAEREQGTLPRILAAPGRQTSVVLGKGIAVFVLALASMTTMYLVMALVFGVHWGDPLAIGAVTVLVVLALMAITSVVQTLARTEAQAASYGSIVGMVLALLGGNFFPLFQMPAFIQRVSALTPNGWALRGFTDIAYDGARLVNILPNLAAIAAFVAVCGSVAAIRARRIALT
jgi:ABC-2 type transport system permease protein